jgi:hypothetical protein
MQMQQRLKSQFLAKGHPMTSTLDMTETDPRAFSRHVAAVENAPKYQFNVETWMGPGCYPGRMIIGEHVPEYRHIAYPGNAWKALDQRSLSG